MRTSSETLVIINADDLGHNPSVNDATFELMSAGTVTSATLLANAAHLESAVAQFSHFPMCSFGIHLNLTSGRPLHPTNPLRTLLEPSGCFDSGQIRAVTAGPTLLRAVYLEFCAQIETLLSLGVAISHIDSHHHIHTIPSLFLALKRLQRKYQIRKVRTTWNILPATRRPSPTLLLKKKMFSLALRHFYPTKTTSGFTDFLTFYEYAVQHKLRHDSVEAMVHPGADGYEEEATLLQSAWRERLPLAFRLASYNDL
jgi:predicted glycoside hydrolase/deacetylase ChbG (UPF0249 family)